MNIKKIKSIKLSLMEKAGEINEESKADYVVYASAEFKIPADFYKDSAKEEKEALLEALVEAIYTDILEKSRHMDADSLGIWINYDGKIMENAMLLASLNDMKIYGPKNISPAFEFFKMTMQEYIK